METTSEYLLDRVRMEMRGVRVDMGTADVSAVFFKSRGLESRIVHIGIDDLGNIQRVLSGYNNFFTAEATRSIGL